MNESDRYRTNKPDVILENFDDEIVIVNLASGNYYSIDTLGAEIWSMLESGFTAGEILLHLSRIYDGSAKDIETAVAEFIQRIIAENLIVPDPAVSAEEKASGNSEHQPRRVFTAPVLNKYTDMQELLLVDPIHEVDETGWPNIPNSAAGSDSNPKQS